MYSHFEKLKCSILKLKINIKYWYIFIFFVVFCSWNLERNSGIRTKLYWVKDILCKIMEKFNSGVFWLLALFFEVFCDLLVSVSSGTFSVFVEIVMSSRNFMQQGIVKLFKKKLLHTKYITWTKQKKIIRIVYWALFYKMVKNWKKTDPPKQNTINNSWIKINFFIWYKNYTKYNRDKNVHISTNIYLKISNWKQSVYTNVFWTKIFF